MKYEFRTKTFSSATLQTEEVDTLKNDATIVGALPADAFPNILEFVKQYLLSKTTDEQVSILSEAVASKAVPNQQAAVSAFRMGSFLFRAMTNKSTKDDSASDLVRDIQTLGVEKEYLSALKAFVQIVEKNRAWYESQQRQESFQKGLFPSLKGVGTTVDLRAVFNDEIGFGESVESYTTRVKLDKETPLMPIVSVALTLDSGHPDRFCFQASPKYISWLIEELRAALHKVTMLEKKYVREQRSGRTR